MAEHPKGYNKKRRRFFGSTLKMHTRQRRNVEVATLRRLVCEGVIFMSEHSEATINSRCFVKVHG